MTKTDPAKSFYTQHGPFTDPGPCGHVYANLPCELDALCGVVNGLLVHDIWNNIGILTLPEARRKEANIRAMGSKLERIQEMDADSPSGPRSLTEPRPFEQRLVGNCRDEALMLCSFMRHAGIPARVRKGFQANLGPKKLDHAQPFRFRLTEPERRGDLPGLVSRGTALANGGCAVGPLRSYLWHRG